MSRLNVATVLVYLQASVWAQGSASITGVVTDASQAPIPSATVKIVNEQSGVTTNAVSNEVGAYRVNSIQPGTYRIEAVATGFNPIVRRNIVLSTGQTLAADLTLQVGDQQTTLVVE